MHNPDARVAPSGKIGVLVVVAKQCESNHKRVEDSGLLVQMVVVVSDTTNFNGHLGLHVLANLRLVAADVVLGDGGEPSGVHPGLTMCE